MSEKNEKDGGTSGDKDRKIIIEHRVVNPKEPKEPKKSETNPPATPPTPPKDDKTGIEDFQKKMKELEGASKKVEELEKKIREMEEEGKTTKEELEKKKAQLLALATREFEKQKALIVDTIKNQLGEEKATEVADKITNPEELESAKLWINYLTSAIKVGEESNPEDEEEEEDKDEEEDTTPKGKATREPPKDESQYESAIHLIDTIAATLMSKTSTPAEKTKANKMLDKLLQSMITGYKKTHRMPSTVGEITSKCPECGKLVIGTVCPFCGAAIKKSGIRWEKR